ncbi:MAG: alkaline phosphatase [Verrucomicrobia bacterium]|nr:alkaline phosphatase [Verrucomicrobiota bacterium]
MQTVPHISAGQCGLVFENPASTRRAFIRRGALVLSATASLADSLAADSAAAPVLRIGLLTDPHYADIPAQGKRHYRESLSKVRAAIEHFNAAKADFVVELGDFIDEAARVEGEIAHLKTIEAEFAKFRGPRHYVLGNHCVWTLTKDQFYANCAAKRAPYSWDSAGFHFIVLDACFRADGVAYGAKNFTWTDTEIPESQRRWLAEDLAATRLPTIVFVHQRIDITGDYAVRSAPAVREILERSGRVLAVFQGHHHRNEHRLVGGIHYCTLMAMVEGNGAEDTASGLLEVFRDGSLKLDGAFKQLSYAWQPPAHAGQ